MVVLEFFGGMLIVAAIVVIIVLVKRSKKKAREEELKKAEEAERIRDEKMKQYAKEQKEKYLQEGLPNIQTDKIALKEKEILHFSSIAALCKHETATVGYKGGGSGASINVIGGVNVHVGSQKITPITQSYLDRTHGTVFLTSQKLVFSGEENILVIYLSDILIAKAEDKLIKIQAENQSVLLDLTDVNKANFLVILEILMSSTAKTKLD